MSENKKKLETGDNFGVTVTFGCKANLNRYLKNTRNIIPGSKKSLENIATSVKSNRPSLIQSLYLDEKNNQSLERIKKYDFKYFQWYESLGIENGFFNWGPVSKEELKKIKTYTERTDYCVQYFINKKPPNKENWLKNYATERIALTQDWEIVRTILKFNDKYVGLMKKKGDDAIQVVKSLGSGFTCIRSPQILLQTRFAHPNVAQTLSYFYLAETEEFKALKIDRYLSFSMQIYPLGDLSHFIKWIPGHCEKLYHPKSEFLKYTSAQVLMALDYLDKIKVVHRDIKPHNMCMNTQGYVKLVDFEFASLLADDEALSEPVGTLGFTPSVPLPGNKQMDYGRNIDIYQFGASFYFLAACAFYRDPQLSHYMYEGDQRDQFFADLNLDKDLTQVLKDCLIEEKDEQDPTKPKRPTPEALMNKYKFYEGIDWIRLFDQEIDLSEKYGSPGSKFDFKAWFKSIFTFNKPKQLEKERREIGRKIIEEQNEGKVKTVSGKK